MKKKLASIALVMMAMLSSCGGSDSKQMLFNGKNLEGWTCVLDEKSDVPTSEVYGVKDGNIHIVGNPFGYMRTDKKYSNYKLHVEWRWVGEGTNSGLFLHVQDGDKLWPNAIECQLFILGRCAKASCSIFALKRSFLFLLIIAIF